MRPRGHLACLRPKPGCPESQRACSPQAHPTRALLLKDTANISPRAWQGHPSGDAPRPRPWPMAAPVLVLHLVRRAQHGASRNNQEGEGWVYFSWGPWRLAPPPQQVWAERELGTVTTTPPAPVTSDPPTSREQRRWEMRPRETGPAPSSALPCAHLAPTAHTGGLSAAHRQAPCPECWRLPPLGPQSHHKGAKPLTRIPTLVPRKVLLPLLPAWPSDTGLPPAWVQRAWTKLRGACRAQHPHPER